MSVFGELSRTVWRLVRARRGQVAVLGVGLAVAAVAFSLLSAATQTGQLRVRAAVGQQFRAAYDLLVLPPSSGPAVEQGGLVRDNFESGLFGGISVKQWHTVASTPGVAVAAPVANLGYVMPFGEIQVPVAKYLATGREQLLRITTSSLPNGGLGRVPGPTDYLFVTPKAGGCAGLGVVGPNPDQPFVLQSPQDVNFVCAEPGDVGRDGTVSFDISFPLLVTAIDPVQENLLLGLNQTVDSGTPLPENAPAQVTGAQIGLPVLVSDRTFENEPLVAHVAEVTAPPGTTLPGLLYDKTLAANGQNGTPDTPNAAYQAVTPLPGRPLGTVQLSSQQGYAALLVQIANPTTSHQVGVSTYWTGGPVDYDRTPAGLRTPRPVVNDPSSTWTDPGYASGYAYAPLDNSGVQFRALQPHSAQAVTVNSTEQRYVLGFDVAGTFDPARLPGFGTTKVPLETYYPPAATAADPASHTALHGQPLTPTANIGGYLAQPPFMLTTIAAIPAMTNSQYFTGANQAAPISDIRVRVAGVTGVDKLSLARIQTAAQTIHRETGLTVDVTTGSSPQKQTIALPAGKFGQPPLTVHEGWSQLGVATVILHAVDTKSRLLVTLILIMSVFFAASAISASLRARRREIGIYRCLGWRRRHLFALVLAEPLLVALLAGITGTLAALAAIGIGHLHVPLGHVLLVTPVGVGLALVAGIIPAALAARRRPLEAVTTPVRVGRRDRGPVHGQTGLALRNLARRPARSAAAILGLAVGVAALTTLVGINLAFRGATANTVLGHVVSIRVQTTDYLAVGIVIALGVLGVIDILLVNVREQAAELAVLRATGWSKRHIQTQARLQGLTLGTLGAALGAAAGIAPIHLLGAPAGDVTKAAILAAAAGILIVTTATIIPSRRSQRIPVATLLTSE